MAMGLEDQGSPLGRLVSESQPGQLHATRYLSLRTPIDTSKTQLAGRKSPHVSISAFSLTAALERKDAATDDLRSGGSLLHFWKKAVAPSFGELQGRRMQRDPTV